MGENLRIELGEGSAGGDRQLCYTEQSLQQRSHLGINRRFTGRQRTIEIEYDQCLHVSYR